MTTGQKQCQVCKRVYASEADFLANTSRWRVCDIGNLWFNCNCGSTLMVIKGKFDWYKPELRLSEEAKGVFHKVIGISSMPRIPSAINRVQGLLKDESVSVPDLASELRHEPVTAACVINYADNIKAVRDDTSKTPIKTLEHAIVYIGRRSLNDILTAAALQSLKLPETGFDFEMFWKKAFLTGAISETLCTKLQVPAERDEAYLAAVLCNIGKLVTNYCFPARVREIVKDMADPQTLLTWSIAERSLNLPGHEILGEIAASLWGLPTYVADAARFHHLNPKHELTTAISQLAAFSNQLAHWLTAEPSQIDETLLDAHRIAFGFELSMMDSLIEDLLPLRDKVFESA